MAGLVQNSCFHGHGSLGHDTWGHEVRRQAGRLVAIGLLLVVVSARPLRAESGVAGAPLVPQDVIATIVPQPVMSGTVVQLPLVLEDPVSPVPFLFVGCFVLPDQLEVLTFDTGPGLDAFIAAQADPPDCDIIIYPNNSGASVFMYMNPPYDPLLYGPEIMRLRVRGGDHSGTTPITVMDQAAGTAQVVAVPIVPAPQLRRGDLDDNGLLTVVDAVRLLSYLVGTLALDCPLAADCDGNGQANISDVVLLVHGMFLGQPQLPTTCEAAPELVAGTCNQTTCDP